MSQIKPPQGMTITDRYSDWLDQLVLVGDHVIVGQRVGDSSRMWLGEVVAIAAVEHILQRFMGRDSTGAPIYEFYSEMEYKAKIQPVRYDGYSTGWKHDWPMEEDIFTKKRVPTGERPKANWIKVGNTVRFPKEI